MILSLLLGCVIEAETVRPADTVARTPVLGPPPVAAPADVTTTLVAPEPGADPATSTAFVFVGDTGKGGLGQRMVAEAIKAWCAQRRCDFVAYLGDNLYPAGAQNAKDPVFADRFERFWEGFDGPFMVALGNHDHLGDIQAEIAYGKTSKKWVQPAAWYRFERGVAEFLVLDTGPGGAGELGPTQTGWLKKTLAGSRSPWRIAYGHHPIHSSGLHGAGPTMVARVEPMLREGGVDFWLCGHEHQMEVLDDGVTPIEIISGAGAEVRKVNPPSVETTYLAGHLGFGYLVLDPLAAHLAMIEVSPSETRVAHAQEWRRDELRRVR
ncbi:MAG: hypothetical protein EXR71_14565 [Myxococcales bacterium]|nr:hypothetical protein [Myxococcales bacterium]